MKIIEQLFQKHGAREPAADEPSRAVGGHFMYCLVRLHTNADEGSKDAFEREASLLFEAIKVSGGDVNQFLGGVLLALFGLTGGDATASLAAATLRLATHQGPVTAIIGEDEGLVGTFGYAERMEVTAVGPHLRRDLRSIHDLPPGINVHQSLVDRVPELGEGAVVNII